MHAQFVHLHCHSEYSLVDGLLRIKPLIAQTAKLDMPAVAITDQSNLCAMVKFYRAALSAGIKPIIGCDVWVENEQEPSQPFRVIFLCQDKEGYGNLTELISKSFLEGQTHGKPVIKKSWLRTAGKGLIAIALARASDIGVAILESNKELAETLVEYWMGVFPERFYLGLTRTGRAEEDLYIESAIDIAVKKECPVVALNDVCFLAPEDFEAHETRVCIHEGVELNDASRPRNYSEHQFFKSTDDMVALFSDIPEALENTVEIAKRCNLVLELDNVFLPQYPVPSGMTTEEYLVQVSIEGLEARFNKWHFPRLTEEQVATKKAVYQQRLEVETNVINSMGFAGYFLIVADFIRWAREQGIPVGPGRGSGAGSLVAYSLMITDIDPLEYDLLFERFLNPERVSMPDFDIDFCMEGRDRVIEYVAKTYGREAVSQIITFGTMAAKAVIRDVGRALGHPYMFVDKIAKLIPMELGITLEKALAEEEILSTRYQQEDEVKTLIDLAKKLEGVTRNVGKHAGGVVIAPSKLTDFSPLYCEENDGQIVTQFDKNDVETIGLVKFDFLGLRTLTIINWAVQTINQQQTNKDPEAVPLDISTISLTDQKTFELLCECDTTAVFQLESRGMKDLIRRLQPNCFEDIVALVALFRPGPLQSGMVDDFINRKMGRSAIEYPHPELEPILKPTYGVILYQEQVMQIAQVLAGYTLGAADMLRRAMGKKKPEEMAKQREIFTKGAVARDVDEGVATYIFDLMEKFAGYGFNKSHSAAYALVSYQTAWLKAHHPAAFMAAVLSSDMANTDKIVLFFEDCRHLKLKILSPNVNRSFYKFSVDDQNRIIYGLGAIKGVGEAAIESILDARKRDGRFQDLFDLCAKVDSRKVTRRVYEALINAGALDELGAHRAALMGNLDAAIQAAEQVHKNRVQGQVDLFGNSVSAEDIGWSAKDEAFKPWTDQVRLNGEKATLGLYLSGHPITQFEPELNQIITCKINRLRPEKGRKYLIAGLIVAIRTMQTKRGDRMAFLSVDDKSGRQEIAVFADVFKDQREVLKKDALILVEGEVSHDEYSGGLKMRATKVMSLPEARINYAKKVNITVDASDGLADNFVQQLRTVLKRYNPGACPISLQYNTSDAIAKIRFGENWSVRPEADLMTELNEFNQSVKAELSYND